VSRIVEFHIYPYGEQHTASMDCRCEPTCQVTVDHPDSGEPLKFIVHGVQKIVVMGVVDGKEFA